MNDEIDRRTLLAGAAGVTGLALAGCTEEDQEDSEKRAERPELTFEPEQLDQPLQFIVQSMDYQNKTLEDIHDRA